MTSDRDLIDRLEHYYDGVPRRRADTEEVGPFTLFVARSGWPYYARPALAGGPITSADVQVVLERQRELGVPQAMEWVDEVTPTLAATAESLGLEVHRCPLMVLEGPPRGDAGTARVLSADDVDDLRTSRVAIELAFAHGGTATGEQGIAERDARQSETSGELDVATLERMASGELCQAAVYAADAPELGPVGGGSYSPVNGVAEITGVGILPAFRRRGLAANLTYLLASDALSHDVRTVFCSADTEDVARVYEGIGFRRVGTACIVEPD